MIRASHQTQQDAMVRAIGRVTPSLQQKLRDEIASLNASKRVTQRQLSGEAYTISSTPQLRARLERIDSDLATANRRLAALITLA